MRFSTGFTSDIPLPFSTRSNTFTAVTFQLEPLSIVYTESLQGDDVEPAIKHLLDQQASGLVGQGASQEGWNRPATWEMGQWLYGPSMQGWCEACHQTSAAPSRLLGWSAKVCPERNLLNLFHHLVVHSSTAFTSDLLILFSTHSSTSWENQIGVLVCKTGTSTCWSKIALVFWTAVTLALQNRPASWVIGKCLHGPSMPGWCQACYQTSC